MQFFKTLPLFNLLHAGLAYKVALYAEEDCAGESFETINVWDNTCSSGHDPFLSFIPINYGGTHQKGTVYYSDDCNGLGESWWEFWADGGDEYFQIDECTSLGFVGHALGSRLA